MCSQCTVNESALLYIPSVHLRPRAVPVSRRCSFSQIFFQLFDSDFEADYGDMASLEISRSEFLTVKASIKRHERASTFISLIVGERNNGETGTKRALKRDEGEISREILIFHPFCFWECNRKYETENNIATNIKTYWQSKIYSPPSFVSTSRISLVRCAAVHQVCHCRRDLQRVAAR